MTLPDHDYSETFSIELEWGEWLEIYRLAQRGVDNPPDDWPADEVEIEKETILTLIDKINENKPGRGIEDWPEPMKKAYDAAIQKIIEDIRDE